MQTDRTKTSGPATKKQREEAEAERVREAEKDTRAIIERYRETFDELAD